MLASDLPIFFEHQRDPDAARMAAFTIPAGATDPAGAEFEVAGERGTFVLVCDVVQARAVGSADST